MTEPLLHSDQSNSDKWKHGGSAAYTKGCRCQACRDHYSERKRAWRASNSEAVERERETSRRWKRDHLGQPGLPAGSRS